MRPIQCGLQQNLERTTHCNLSEECSVPPCRTISGLPPTLTTWQSRAGLHCFKGRESFWGDNYTDDTFDYTDYTLENVGWIIRDYTCMFFFLIIQIIHVWITLIILLVMDCSDNQRLYVIIFFCNDYTDYTYDQYNHI